MLQDKLLGIYEQTGQLKALCDMASDKNSLIQEQRRILYSLSTELASLKSDLLDNDILTKLPNYQTIQNQTTDVADKLQRIISIIDNDIVLNQNLSSDINAFSKQIEEAMHSQEQLYNLFLYTYKYVLDELIEKSKEELNHLILGFIIIVVIALYIYIAFYISIADNLKKLQMASEMISKGKNRYPPKSKEKDEIGKALLAFNTMSDKLNKKYPHFLNGV